MHGITAWTVGMGVALPQGQEHTNMLKYAVIFFIVALAAAVLGFGGLAAGAAGIARILFWLFLAVALVTGVMELAKKA